MKFYSIPKIMKEYPSLIGISNITEYELAAHWTIGESGYSTIRLFEFAHCREDSIDILNLQKQL